MPTITYNAAANTLFVPADAVEILGPSFMIKAVQNLCVATANYHRPVGYLSLGEDGGVVLLDGAGTRLADGFLPEFLKTAAENLCPDIVVKVVTGTDADAQRVFDAVIDIAGIAVG